MAANNSPWLFTPLIAVYHGLASGLSRGCGGAVEVAINVACPLLDAGDTDSTGAVAEKETAFAERKKS